MRVSRTVGAKTDVHYFLSIHNAMFSFNTLQNRETRERRKD